VVATFEVKQRRVRFSIAAGVAASAGVAALGYAFVPAPAVASLSDRLRLGVECACVAALALAAAVGAIAMARYGNPEAIDGQRSPGGRIDTALRILQNTLEQLVLAAVAYVGFAALAPARMLPILPAMVGWWLVGRMLFAVGYFVGDNARAFGFVATFIPSATMLVYDVFLLASG
jgi:hypothetical protein